MQPTDHLTADNMPQNIAMLQMLGENVRDIKHTVSDLRDLRPRVDKHDDDIHRIQQGIDQLSSRTSGMHRIGTVVEKLNEIVVTGNGDRSLKERMIAAETDMTHLKGEVDQMQNTLGRIETLLVETNTRLKNMPGAEESKMDRAAKTATPLGVVAVVVSEIIRWTLGGGSGAP